MSSQLSRNEVVDTALLHKLKVAGVDTESYRPPDCANDRIDLVREWAISPIVTGDFPINDSTIAQLGAVNSWVYAVTLQQTKRGTIAMMCYHFFIALRAWREQKNPRPEVEYAIWSLMIHALDPRAVHFKYEIEDFLRTCKDEYAGEMECCIMSSLLVFKMTEVVDIGVSIESMLKKYIDTTNNNDVVEILGINSSFIKEMIDGCRVDIINKIKLIKSQFILQFITSCVNENNVGGHDGQVSQ